MILAPAIFVVANHSNNIKSAHSLRKPIVSAFVGAIFLTGGIVGPAGVHFVPTVYAEEWIDNSDGSMSYSDIPDVLNSNSTISPDTTATAIQYMAEMYGSISVLNEQSYPVVGGLWSTQFVTSGTHDLVITGINGTTFSGASPVSTVEINGSTVPSLDISIGDEFGSSLTNIGDLNGDGVPDLAVGARADDSNAGIDRGAVHILFMNTTGAVNSTVEINSSTANGPILNNNDQFGSSITNIGDLNNDGVQDLAVGARFDNNNGTLRGTIHILFMNTTGAVNSTVEINDSTPNGPVLDDSDFFGHEYRW